MATTLDRNAIERLAVSFMVDRVGVDHDAMAGLLGTDLADLIDVLEGRGSTNETTRPHIDALAAIQSLLLSGYTPDGAVAWMNAPAHQLGGMSPAAMLMSRESASIPCVLRAAYDRMSS